MDRMSDGMTPVVHLVMERMYDVDRGHGNVEQEFADMSLCDRWATPRWVKWADNTVPTCLQCLYWQRYWDSLLVSPVC